MKKINSVVALIFTIVGVYCFRVATYFISKNIDKKQIERRLRNRGIIIEKVVIEQNIEKRYIH